MRRRDPGRVLHGLVLAGMLAFCGAVAALPAIAFEPLSANKNFTPPGSVPDYFSSEAAPFNHASPPATQGADRFNTAPIRAGRAHALILQPASSRTDRHATDRHVAASRSGRAHAGRARGRSAHVHRYAKPASRHSIATSHHAAASRNRYAAHSTRHSRRVFR